MDDPRSSSAWPRCRQADKFQLHIYAALAEQERDFISVRTKAALAAAKARGVKLGGDRGNLATRNAAIKAKADAAAQKVIGVIAPMREQGMSLQAIADQLNTMGNSSIWSPMKVKRASDRVAL